jgi:ParB-like chromosome segregation protein Spo0J
VGEGGPGEGGQGELVELAQPAAIDVAGAAELVPLASIYANPYQPRTDDDPAALAEIALSIFRNGLMQIPVARSAGEDGDCFQLAFGHTRWKAFDLLAYTGLPQQGIAPDERFAVMPLRILPLSDRQMFEMAVSENLKRRDLNAIEQAGAMQMFMDQFSATSREAAELFGVNAATVRGLTRLLKLPAPVQRQIAEGKITQGVARKLLSVTTVDPKMATQIGESIMASSNDPEKVIEWSLNQNKKFLSMWQRYSKGDTPLAGVGLWPLDYPVEPKALPELQPKDVIKALALEATPEMKKRVWSYIAIISEPDEHRGLTMDNLDLVEQIKHLLQPPACSGCPLHLALDGNHFCGMKLCHARKTEVWVQLELRMLSSRLGIGIYNPGTDGKAILPLVELTWSAGFKAASQMVEQKDALLRLVESRSDYHKHEWTESYLVCVAMIGKRATEVIEEKKSAAAEQKAKSQQQDQIWTTQRIMRQAAEKFYDEHIPELFAPAFSGLDNVAALCALTDVEMPKASNKKAAALAQCRVELADQALKHDIWDIGKSGPLALAKHFKGVAKTWGVELPADFLDIARSYEPEAVSTETPQEAGDADD